MSDELDEVEQLVRFPEPHSRRTAQRVLVGLAVTMILTTAISVAALAVAVIAADRTTDTQPRYTTVVLQRNVSDRIGPPDSLDKSGCRPDAAYHRISCDGVYVSGPDIFIYPPRGDRFPYVGNRSRRESFRIVEINPIACGTNDRVCKEDLRDGKERAVELGVKFRKSQHDATKMIALPFVIGNTGNWYDMQISDYEFAGSECFTLCSPVIGLVKPYIFDQYAQTVNRLRWVPVPESGDNSSHWVFVGENTDVPGPFLFELTNDMKEVRYCGTGSPFFCHKP